MVIGPASFRFDAVVTAVVGPNGSWQVQYRGHEPITNLLDQSSFDSLALGQFQPPTPQ